MALFEWLESTWLAVLVRETLWGYPIFLTCHAVGMAIVVGIMLMIDLRVLGYASEIPMASLRRLFSVAWVGFALNLVSGFGLFSGDAARFATSIPFLTKMSCIVAGGIAAWMLVRAVYGAPGTLSGDAVARDGIVIGTKAKVIAGISIVLWLTAMTAGRLTAYL